MDFWDISNGLKEGNPCLPIKRLRSFLQVKFPSNYSSSVVLLDLGNGVKNVRSSSEG